MAREGREAFCFLCGRTMGKKNITIKGKPWMKTGEENMWEKTQDFTQKPFGVIKSSEGRGTMAFVRYYGIEEDKEGYFPFIKARLLVVIGEFLTRGWLTREEVLAAMGAAAPAPAKTKKKK